MGGTQDYEGQVGTETTGVQVSAQDNGGQQGSTLLPATISGQREPPDLGPRGSHTPLLEGQIESVQDTWYPIIVLLPVEQTKFILKIEKYFTSKTRSGGGGNCKVTKIDPSTYRVYFQDQEARDRVLKKDHKIEDLSVQVMAEEDVMVEDVTRTHQTSRATKTVDQFTENRRQKHNTDLACPELSEVNDRSGTHQTGALPEDRSFPEIFFDTCTKLNVDMFPRDILQEIRHRFPSLKILKEHGVEIRGSYKEIEKLHKFLEAKLGGDVHDEEPMEQGGDDCLNLTTALYEYITDIYKEEVAQIEGRCHVQITEVRRSRGSSYITMKPRGQDSSVDKAMKNFTIQVQAITKDWSQKEVPLSTMKASLEDTRSFMKERHKTSVIVDGNRLILRGPERELPLAEEALQKGAIGSLLPRRVITISSKDSRSEVLVDARHMDILKKLKSREIEDLQQKYSVRMEEKGKDRNVIVSFRAMNGGLNLGAHACHSFTNLLHGTITNLQSKTIKANLEIDAEKLNQFRMRLQRGGVDVILEHDKGSIILITSPVLLEFAEEKLQKFLRNPDAQEAPGTSTEEAMDTSKPTDRKTSAEEDEQCPICLDQMKNKKVLPKCKHEFCAKCLQKSLDMKPVCPVCAAPYGVVIGNQPEGTMTNRAYSSSLPGYSGCGTIEINYHIPGGIQQKDHPNPGKRFSGTDRRAYLPDNQEGREVLCLLSTAFKQKLIFTVGESRTTGAKDTVTWNDIHHKTNTTGGPAGFGYPDPDYLKRVRDELKAKGVE